MADGVAVGAADQPRPVEAGARARSLDLIRGFALLGILGPNIIAFSWPSGAQYAPEVMGMALEFTTGAAPHTDANELSHRVVQVLFHGKMMFLFSLLFGAGVVMYARKFEGPSRWCGACGYDLEGLGTTPDNVCPECGARDPACRPKLSHGARLWYTRCGWLLAIGLVHAFALWYGDILVWYAVAGMGFVWWVRRWRPRTLLIAGGASYLAGTLMLTAFMIAGLVFQGREAMLGDIEGEVAAYTGAYTDALANRAITLLVMYVLLIPFGFFWSVSGMMMLGIALTRTGVLTGERSDAFYARLAAVCLPLGLALTALAIVAINASGVSLPGFVFMGMGQSVGIPISLGYAAVLILLLRRRLLGPLTHALECVGRMAFSNYLLQTLICTTIFYGHAGGMYARVQYPELWLVVVGVWVVNIVFSVLWLRVFRFGPAEWLWRSLTYLRLQPMLREKPAGA